VRREVVLALDGTEMPGLEDEAARSGIDRVIRRIPKPEAKGSVVVVPVSDSRGAETKAAWVRVRSGSDIGAAIEASAGDYSFVVVECSDWKVIPLENLIADFRRRGKKLFAYVKGKDEVGLAFSILERGVDGVVVPPNSIGEARALAEVRVHAPIQLQPARITKVVDAGVGDRVCVDTTSQLELGEGMLVGSRASFLYLVHGETVPTQYIATRPFRVNAGSVHSYLLVGGEKTRYLSELEAGDRVLLVRRDGSSREAVVGRVKIERRPMMLIEATMGEEKGSVILQNAETIRLVRKGGEPVGVTELKEGDEILVQSGGPRGRHFGGEVDEFVIER
jgi:3-dehydroquinate synthase II